MDDLDAQVGQWLTVPDMAERLGIGISRVHALVQDRKVIGLRRGERKVLSIPELFLVPAPVEPSAVEPADVEPERDSGGRARSRPAPAWQVLPSLPGTLSALADAGYTDADALAWLVGVDEVLGARPIDLLRVGTKAPVRRRVQELAF